MPTPTQAFFDIAARHGDVDSTDPQAVQRWFAETLPSLPPAEIEEILEELLALEAHEGTADTDLPPRHYPKDARLPTLDDSPSAPLPFLAAGWREWLAKRLSSTRGRHGS